MSSDAQPPHRVVPPSRRRDKPILSCTLCRRRKLKCDRQHPCKTCVDRGLSLSCTYVPITGPAGTTSIKDSKAPNNVHDRIDQLEKLVTSLMEEKVKGRQSSSDFSTPGPPSYANGPSDDETNPDVASTPVRVKLEDDATTYSNSGHWTSILDGITELRGELDDIPTTAQPRDSSQAEIAGPDLLFGRQRHVTKNEILAAVPPRAEADQLIDAYFEAMDMAPSLLHRPTFMREYNEFWNNPFNAPVMWLGLLFSILAIGVRFQYVFDNPGGVCDQHKTLLYTARIDNHRSKLVQCLILANYTKCPPYTIETLFGYFVTEYLRSQDTQFGIWMLCGMIVRIAFRMGYHRDPSRFSNISPFKAEMRRRLWLMTVQLDLMSSSQVGLPRMIQSHVYDVQEPRNLTDEDLDENMTELPPSRPDTDTTVMLYALVRNRVLGVFSRIADLANSTTQPAYREVMDIDIALKNVYENMPESMKVIRVRDFDFSSHETIDFSRDSRNETKRRLFLGLTFLRAALTLHRPYFLLGRTDPRYEYSRLVCLDAAMEMLQYQRKLEDEAQPGGKLWSSKWRLWTVSWRQSSLICQDFLLATTVLLSDLDKDITSPLPVDPGNSANRVRFRSGQPTRAEIIETLTAVFDIWANLSEESRESKKVATALRYVLDKAGVTVGNSPGEHETPLSNFDFAAFAQKIPNDNFANTIPDFSFFNVNNSQFVPPLQSTDSLMDVTTFNWGGLETDMALPTFEQNNFQDYL